ncbi:MAG: cysteine--tRNA ligase [Clostridia bacterium]|nr:cysteine--tRNA ligase [Clostridia bacterium]
MKLFNTLTNKKEDFIPIEEGKIKMYCCGPTVYNFFHLGNSRPLIIFDAMRRFFEYIGYDVTFVQNFTDIDDKMIKKANEEGVTVKEIAERYIAEYKTDASGLGIKEASVHPKATENIPEIIELVKTLIEKGHAYESNGDVYFRTHSFDSYGKLSHQPLSDLEEGARIDVNEQKESAVDFALWKAAKPGEPHWTSPWGEGRPGWHIECSAMATKYLGKTIDIHAGGVDLVFPHHENEIAQSECAHGCDFAKYWVHNGFINVDNQKMSKSLNNFFTVRDIASQYGYDVIRYFILSAHYRNPINYTVEILEQCKASIQRIVNCFENLCHLEGVCESKGISASEAASLEKIKDYKKSFISALEDDFNTADAIGYLFETVREINTNAADGASLEYTVAAKELLIDINGIISVVSFDKKDSLDSEVEALIAERQAARAAKDYKRADEIRDTLKNMGIILEDTKNGVKWRKE